MERYFHELSPGAEKECIVANNKTKFAGDTFVEIYIDGKKNPTWYIWSSRQKQERLYLSNIHYILYFLGSWGLHIYWQGIVYLPQLQFHKIEKNYKLES